MAAGNRQNHIRVCTCISISFRYVLCIAALAACQPQPEALLSEYQSRLQRVLRLSPSPATNTLSKVSVDPLPAVRTLTIDIPASTIDLTDMLALDICDLETLIAERNNSLGKVQTDAARLQYELQLLVKLGKCLQTPALSAQLTPELAAALQQIYRLKQQQLSAVFTNLLSRDQTLRQQLHGSQRGIGADQSGIAETVQALKQLNLLRQHIQQQDYNAASEIQIIQSLGALHHSQLIADLQHSLRLSLQFFAVLNTALEQQPSDQLCRSDKTVRENLLQQIFIGRVQPELARIDGMATELIAELVQLYQHHPLQASVQQRLQLPHQHLQLQLRSHVAFWQRWRQCDLGK